MHIVGLCTIEFITTLRDCSRPVNYLRPSNKFQVYSSFFSSQLNKNKVSGIQREPISAGINALIIENNRLKDLVSEAPELNYFHADIVLDYT